jgi:tripartite-type tricarboxylate transporter receptor subunit TctC
VLVPENSRFKTLGDLLAEAKAKPGKLNIATIAVGSTQNLAAELFKTTAGIDAQVVPFNGTPAVMTALRGVVAPARTPAPVIARLNRELNAVLADPAIRAKLLEAGVEAKGTESAALGQLMTSEAEKWRSVIERAGIEKQ